MLQKQRWVFTAAELDYCDQCLPHFLNKYSASDEFTTGPVLCGPADRKRVLRNTELGVFVQRNGTVTRRWDDGTAGVPADIAALAGDIESYATVNGETTVADNWRDVLCTSDGKFVCFDTPESKFAAIRAIWTKGCKGSDDTGEGLYGYLADQGYLERIEDIIRADGTS
jgi:hypothetical protein